MKLITELPLELKNSCKCEPIDPDWPIQDPVQALNLLYEWDALEGLPEKTLFEQIFGLTHSHHHEYEELDRLGVDRLYKEGRYTKCVSIAWHLAGRYTYDEEFIRILSASNWKINGYTPRLIDFGAAPWIQSIFYANKGMHVTAVNQSIESDAHRFGRFLAEKHGYYKKGDKWVHNDPNKGTISEYDSDDKRWQIHSFEIVYAIDVFEHIPPDPDGTAGWIKYADMLYDCFVPGGMWYVNAPFGIQDGPILPVESHPVHYTSPFTIQEWNAKKGLVQKLYMWHKKTE